MMRVRHLAVLALGLLPALAFAQVGGGMGGMGGGRGGMGGGRSGGRGGMGGARSAPKFPNAKDLERLNPAALLVDKRKKLSLADSQVALLKALELTIFERNGTLMLQYDSLRRDYRPPSGEAVTAADDKARNSAMLRMQQMRTVLEQLIERRKRDVQETLDLIPEEQKRKAAELIDKQDQEFLEQIPSSGALQGGEGRRGRPGGR